MRRAVVFDVDGVLLRGNTRLPFTPRILARLKESKVPYMFLTNGGGVLESEKARQLSKLFETDISEKEVCLSHTPMKGLVDSYKDKLVLVTGKGDNPVDISKAYGFKKVVSIPRYCQHHNFLYPDLKEERFHNPAYDEPVAAVMAFNDPLYWGRELQILCDLARSTGIPGQHPSDDSQPVNFYFSGPDFEYSTEHNVPRFGSGAFRACLEHLFTKVTRGRILKHTVFGKPEAASYRYAEKVLREVSGGNIDRIYAIGDNPLTDIVGANLAGDHWASVLVKTGCWDGVSENHEDFAPDMTCEDAEEAVERIIADRG